MAKIIEQVIEAGWCLHPVYSYNTKKMLGDRSARKSPLLPKDWQGNSSNDIKQVKKWYFDYKEKLKENPALAVALGKKSGVFVLDVDCKHNSPGLASLEKLEMKYGSLRNGNFYVNTPSGGVHIYFILPNSGKEIVNKNKLAEYPGIEIKSTGTYVLLLDTGYKAQNTPKDCSPCPAWIFDLYKEEQKEETEKEPDVSEERNNYLTSRCGEFRMAGMEETLALNELSRLNHELYDNCSKGPLTEREVKIICKSVYRYDKPIDVSDYAIANRIIELLDGELCYITEYKEFFVYKEGVWSLDSDNLTGKIIFELKDDLLEMITRVQSKIDRKKLLRKIKNIGNAGGHASVMKVLKEVTSKSIEGFDANSNYICLLNGVLDLNTHQFYEHNKKFFLTRKMNVSYNIESTALRYDKFMNETFCNDESLRQYTEKLIALSMLGECQEHIFPIFYGDGQNGKSTLTELMEDIFEDYAESSQGEKLIQNKNNNSGDYFLADLKGKRIVIASETSHNSNLDPSLVKYSTGGDKIKARAIYGKPFSFKPQFTIFLITNNKPKIKDSTFGMWRRVKLIPFENTVKEEDKIKGLGKILFKEEASGIFNVWLKMLKDYQINGLIEPDKVKTKTSEYKNSQDLVYNFVAEKCLLKKECRINLNNLYSAFKEWCDLNGERGGNYMSSQILSNDLKRLYKIEKKHTNKGNVWAGIGLIDENQSDM